MLQLQSDTQCLLTTQPQQQFICHQFNMKSYSSDLLNEVLQNLLTPAFEWLSDSTLRFFLQELKDSAENTKCLPIVQTFTAKSFIDDDAIENHVNQILLNQRKLLNG